MKKANITLLSILLILLFTGGLKAQITLLTNGNAGVGTTAPAFKLELIGTSGNTLKIVDTNQGLGKVLTSDASGIASWSSLDSIVRTGNLTFAGDKKISYQPISGNFGNYSFGKIPPQNYSIDLCSTPQKDNLYFNGMFKAWGYEDWDSQNPITVMSMGFDGANGIIDLAGTKTGDISPSLLINYYCGKDVFINTGEHGGNIQLTNSGKVGIGTNEIPEGYKLAIVGKTIASDEVIIKLQGEWWPDFVFAKDYKLMPLKELENYLIEHKHLPDVPSASDIKTNGIPLAEMSSLFLKKIEELTLIAIEQNKKIEAQQQKIIELENKINAAKN